MDTARALPRPGRIFGAYPERRQRRAGGFDVARALGNATRVIASQRTAHHARFLALVEHEHANLFDARARRDNSALGDLKHQLERLGFEPCLVARAFAIIRDLAHRTLGQRHHDCQLLGGRVMLEGGIAEMQTGEGKTLTATLSAGTAALAGIPVHVVTANDYLAQRDAELMAPLYAALGLSLGVVTSEVSPDARRSAYACDITYCTDKQLVFDYLNDCVTRAGATSDLDLKLERLHSETPRSDRLRLRGLCFAIVDEIDCTLIDQARTPLILSRPAGNALSEECIHQALTVARELRESIDFRTDPRAARLALTARGRNRLTTLAGDLPSPWSSARRREALATAALRALHLHRRDHDYLVDRGAVAIIDADTGRTMPDRRWDGGVHQMVEAKEGVPITPSTEVLARISYQEFFRRYLRVAGMTGTAREVARELAAVHDLDVVTIPPHRPSCRSAHPVALHACRAAKHAAIAASCAHETRRGRPVLIGTRSVAESEALAACLQEAGLTPQVLNARQDAGEAAIVSRAGEAGRITVATNMAGRGTDIRLGQGVTEAGGLHVIVAEPNEARRIDRQLIGRCARQGEPGTHVAMLSLDDEVLACTLPVGVRRLLAWSTPNGHTLPGWLAAVLVRIAQARLEGWHARARRAVLRAEDGLARRLSFSAGNSR